jgi:tetratricopeptide (TPR) repeat protein
VELVGRLLSAKVPGLLLLLTVRDDATVPWSAPTRIELDRLSLEELSQLARRLPEARNLDPTDLERAVERSDGIPLFLEELVRSSSLAQAGAGSDGPTSIPPALRDLLLARFAAPGVDLRFVQLLATIGADLTRDVVVGASSLPVAEVDEQLRRLVEQRILALAEGEEDAYRFHHQLLVDLAYETQLLPARRRAHSSVADALLQSGLAALDPAVTSHHLEQADRIAEAIGWACTAAERSVSLGAQAEAGGVLDHAFALLDQVAPDERPALEFEVRLLRGVTVAGTLGYAAPQAVSDFQASLDLVKLLDREVDVEEAGLEAYFSQERIWSSVGLWATFLLQGRLADADEVLLGLMAPLAREGFLYRYWNGMRGFVDFFAGDYAKAEPLLREAVAGLEQISMPHRISIPHDPLASAQVHLAFVCAIRCEFEESRELIDRALARARSLPFPRGPFTVCYVAGMGAAIELFLGDPDRSLELVGEQMALAERHGFTFWTIVSGFYLAMMDAYEGDPGAMVRAEMSVMLLQGIGVECWLPMFHEALAACFELAGDLEGASRALDEALRAEERLGIHHWGAESLRLRGAIRLRQGDRGGLDDLRAAIDLAVAQGAVLHEAWARQALCDQVDDPAEHEALAHVVVSLGDRAVGLHEVNASMAGLSKR